MIQLILISAEAKNAEDGADFEVLTNDNGGSGGLGTESAITAIGGGIFLLIILICCVAMCCCKYR